MKISSNTYDSVIELIKKNEEKNKLDEIIFRETKTPVYAEEKKVTQSEFYQGQAAGFKPEISFAIAEYMEYTGEEFLDCNGKRYKIVRTTKTDNERELLIICESTVNPWEANSDADAEVSSEV